MLFAQIYSFNHFPQLTEQILVLMIKLFKDSNEVLTLR